MQVHQVNNYLKTSMKKKEVLFNDLPASARNFPPTLATIQQKLNKVSLKIILKKFLFNIFASECLVLEDKPFCLENALNLTHEFCVTIKKISKFSC